MYAHKIHIILCLTFLILLLSACGERATDESVALSALFEAGTLTELNIERSQAAEPRLAQVFRDDLVQTWDIAVTTVFPNSYMLQFDEENMSGRMQNIAQLYHTHQIFENDYIRRGDFIAELRHGYNREAEIDRSERAIALQEFNTWFAGEDNRRQVSIDNQLRDLEFAENWEIAAFELLRAELEYELFIRESSRRRTNLMREIAELDEAIKGERLYSPVDGFITHRTLATDGTVFLNIPDVFHYGQSIMEVVDDSVVQFMIRGSTEVIRFGDIFRVHDVIASGVSFDVRVVSDPLIHAVSRPSEQEFVLIPADPDAFAAELESHGLRQWDLQNINLRARPTVLLANNGVLVDRWALNTEFTRHYVFVYENGEIFGRYVNVGAILGDYVQILSGLEPGQWVVVQ